MRRHAVAFIALAYLLLAAGGPAGAREHVRFLSFATGVTGERTPIDGYLYRPGGAGPSPAVVFLHGCGGLLTRKREPQRRATDWAHRLNADGFVVLMVDSFSARGITSMCSPASFVKAVFDARPLDAFGALSYLRSQPFVDADRVGLMGWSEGGGATLFAIRGASTSGFAAAVAFYPASCNAHRLGTPWKSTVPLLVLIGESDVWTPAAPCVALMKTAPASTRVEVTTYPGAYHDFDWPGLAVHALPADRTAAGVVPIAGMNPAARADALERVPAFLKDHL